MSDNLELQAILRKIERDDVRKHYWRYVEITHIQGENKHWIPSKYHKYMCNKVQEFIERPSTKPYEILIIECPVQTGKSMTITQTLPSWYLGMYPDNRVLEISYNSDFAEEFSKKNREKVLNYGDWLFDIRLSSKNKKQSEIRLDGHRGEMNAFGILSGITGRTGELILIDDPFKTREEAYSENHREKVWGEWQTSVKTRTHPGSKIILVMSRWHEDDLAGRIMKYESDWEEVRIPCEADSEDDVLGREIGDAICPEIGKDNAWKDKFKADYVRSEGLSTWNAMFQGKPSSEKGNIVNRAWWQYYEDLPQVELMIMSADCTFKDTKRSDFVAIQCWGKSGSNLYLIDSINKRMGLVDTISAIRGMKNKYPKVSMILIEDKANGSAVIETLRKEIMGVVPIEPKGGKEARVHAISPIIESGNCYLPKYATFTEEFVEQFSAFPLGAHDDIVDCSSQVLFRFKEFKFHAKPIVKKDDFFKSATKVTNPFKFGVSKSFLKF